MGAQHCDTFAMFGEPLAETAERIATFRRMAKGFGRPAPKFNVSFRPILGQTEGEAWDKAQRILADLKEAPAHLRGQDQSGKRLVDLAERGDVHDERLWMSVAALSGGKGNTSCLVGTPEQVADAMLKYYRMGVGSFLIRGFDPLNDAREYGKELIPRLKAGALVIDQETALAA
jgi:alkanesulfonate monooxygenase